MNDGGERKGVLTSTILPRYDSVHVLEKLKSIYKNCRHKSFYPNGRPRPCRSQRCPCEACRRKYSEKEAIILKRSFRERPPTFCFTLKLTDGRATTDVEMASLLRCFCQRIRDFRKGCQEILEYDIRIEFRRQQPHAHLSVISSIWNSKAAAKQVVKGWWSKSCPSRLTSVYCDFVHNVEGWANYIAKNVIDRKGIERPPSEWDGRKCRLVWRSRGFLTKSKAALWREQCEEWYPIPVPPSESVTSRAIDMFQMPMRANALVKKWFEGNMVPRAIRTQMARGP